MGEIQPQAGESQGLLWAKEVRVLGFRVFGGLAF